MGRLISLACALCLGLLGSLSLLDLPEWLVLLGLLDSLSLLNLLGVPDLLTCVLGWLVGYVFALLDCLVEFLAFSLLVGLLALRGF